MDLKINVEKVRALMRKNGVTMNDIGRNSGKSHGVVRDLLSGKVTSPRIETLGLICSALNCDPEYLLDRCETVRVPEHQRGTIKGSVIGSLDIGDDCHLVVKPE